MRMSWLGTKRSNHQSQSIILSKQRWVTAYHSPNKTYIGMRMTCKCVVERSQVVRPNPESSHYKVTALKSLHHMASHLRNHLFHIQDKRQLSAHFLNTESFRSRLYRGQTARRSQCVHLNIQEQTQCIYSMC